MKFFINFSRRFVELQLFLIEILLCAVRFGSLEQLEEILIAKHLIHCSSDVLTKALVHAVYFGRTGLYDTFVSMNPTSYTELDSAFEYSIATFHDLSYFAYIASSTGPLSCYERFKSPVESLFRLQSRS